MKPLRGKEIKNEKLKIKNEGKGKSFLAPFVSRLPSLLSEL
jgi:hypothetical protein